MAGICVNGQVQSLKPRNRGASSRGYAGERRLGGVGKKRFMAAFLKKFQSYSVGFLTSRVQRFLPQKENKKWIRVPAGAYHFIAAPAGRASAIAVPNGAIG
ncbi:MAG: hypothetical protein WC835_02800 [Candidatus Paceibacterota bacterium]